MNAELTHNAENVRPQRRCGWFDEYGKQCVYQAEHTVDHFVYGQPWVDLNDG